MLTESSRRSRPGRRAAGVVLPRLVGQDLEVQLAGGETRSYVNLDMAASTPAMELSSLSETPPRPSTC